MRMEQAANAKNPLPFPCRPVFCRTKFPAGHPEISPKLLIKRDVSMPSEAQESIFPCWQGNLREPARSVDQIARPE
jgi:hypothetical protein